MAHRSIAAHIPTLAGPSFQRLSKDEIVLAEVVAMPDRPAEPSSEERLAAEYARGRADALAEARAEAEAILASERQALEAAAEAERCRFEADFAERLGADLAACMAELERQLADAIARCLEPVIEQAMVERTVDAFSATLSDLLSGSEAPTIVVSGPAALLQRLSEGLGAAGRAAVRLDPSNDVELRCVLDDTTVETQLADWLSEFHMAREQQS
ncbi:hypothetical protein [Polymorphum gilvum]|uniref:Uncharacterized protein n=1 Tax=Polymorphum gilvum (strain LMG 25793 / CGMCC 1.9160 / SL003B-26A1) TaxID=991905 RepID=F2J5D0_POLGS|nr:hypothetical protein [Polymorphum gilvum]ADZ72300.1 hypothetical protein SL003B_3880 [Polymorphum gilvum SL003B-26A1]